MGNQIGLVQVWLGEFPEYFEYHLKTCENQQNIDFLIFNNQDYSKDGRIKNLTNINNIFRFLDHKGFNVVVSVVSPYKEMREEFKKSCGDGIVEIYVHTNRKRQREQFKVEGYEPPELNFFDMDTTSDNPVQSFTKLVHYLRENDVI